MIQPPQDAPSHHLCLLPGRLAICRLEADRAVPAWAATGTFFSITRTSDEVSIICDQDLVPAGVHCERGFRCLKLHGPIPFSAVGVLASLVQPLAAAGISVFAVSTFDTDFVLVKEVDVVRATAVLRQAGHKIA
jgi:hypothetical protein